MKNILILSCSVFLLLSLSFSVHAQELISSKLYKDVYSPGETIQLEIFTQDPIKDPQSKDISLTQDDTKVAISPFLKKINQDHYFLFFNLPLTIKDGSYKLGISNIPFIVNGILQEQSHSVGLNIKKELPLLSISPGIILPDDNLEITVSNKGQSTSVKITAPSFISHVYQQPQLINEGTSRKFIFNVDQSKIEAESANITISYEKEYVIPIIFSAQITSPQQPIQQNPDPISFITSLPYLNRTIREDKTFEGTLVIKNMLNKTLNDISIYLIGDLDEITEFSPESITLPPLAELGIDIIVNKEKSLKKPSYSGSLVATYQGFSMPFSMDFIREEKPKKEEVATQPTVKEAQEEDQDIEDFFNYSVAPQPEKKQKHTTLVIFLVILAIGLVIYILFKKPITRKQSFSQYIKKMEKR